MAGLEQIDFGVSQWFLHHHSSFGDWFFGEVTQLGERRALACTMLAALASLVVIRRYRSAVILLVVGLITPFLSAGTKDLIERDRPAMAAEIGVTGYSFPSGHCTGVAAIYGMFALILVRSGERSTRRWLFLAPVGMLIFAVGVSRLYLGVHYPCDVIGGWSAGLGLALTGLWVDMRLESAVAVPQLPAMKDEGPPPELVPFPEVDEQSASQPLLGSPLSLARGEND
jgi:membrane-associated phospholipid phosphatase